MEFDFQKINNCQRCYLPMTKLQYLTQKITCRKLHINYIK